MIGTPGVSSGGPITGGAAEATATATGGNRWIGGSDRSKIDMSYRPGGGGWMLPVSILAAAGVVGFLMTRGA